MVSIFIYICIRLYNRNKEEKKWQENSEIECRKGGKNIWILRQFVFIYLHYKITETIYNKRNSTFNFEDRHTFYASFEDDHFSLSRLIFSKMKDIYVSFYLVRDI